MGELRDHRRLVADFVVAYCDTFDVAHSYRDAVIWRVGEALAGDNPIVAEVCALRQHVLRADGPESEREAAWRRSLYELAERCDTPLLATFADVWGGPMINGESTPGKTARRYLVELATVAASRNFDV